MFDVIVIGGGVVGGLIFRELTKYRLSACLLEKENDVCMGASKANSGIVHAGFDAKKGSLKAKFNVLGNKMMPSLARDLSVKYKNNGSLVVVFSEEETETLKELKDRGEMNGVTGLEILDKSALQAREPNISDAAVAALYAPTGGIVCPYELTIAAIGNAMDNGGTLLTGFEVNEISKSGDFFCVKSVNGQTAEGKFVINCAGLYSGKIAALVGDDIEVKGRKGEYILLDRESGDFVSHTLFFTPTKMGKGILVSPTVDGNILLGPTAKEVDGYETETDSEGLADVMEKAKKMCKNPPFFNTITSFAGVRAFSSKNDFILEESQTAAGFFHCAGIESPGLTAAPAIAEYVVQELIGGKICLERNAVFDGTRKPYFFFNELTLEEKNALIADDPAFGKMVCRCERITEGEIVRAIHENPPAKDIDGVKRRTRAGMGRCQSGFCQPRVAELIAKELNIPLTEVNKKGEKSYLLSGVTK